MEDARRERDRIGVAVVGAGRMGTHRARLAATHPAVDFLAIADVDPTRAAQLAEQTGAQLATDDPAEVIDHPQVTTVIVDAVTCSETSWTTCRPPLGAAARRAPRVTLS